MKKIKILINILIVFIFVVSIISLILLIEPYSMCYRTYQIVKDIIDVSDHDMAYAIDNLYRTLFPLIFCALTALACVVTILLLNLKVFNSVSFKELVDRHKQVSESRKSERLAAKQAKQEAEKQKEIEELEKKLDELKKE